MATIKDHLRSVSRWQDATTKSGYDLRIRRLPLNQAAALQRRVEALGLEKHPERGVDFLLELGQKHIHVVNDNGDEEPLFDGSDADREMLDDLPIDEVGDILDAFASVNGRAEDADDPN